MQVEKFVYGGRKPQPFERITFQPLICDAQRRIPRQGWKIGTGATVRQNLGAEQ